MTLLVRSRELRHRLELVRRTDIDLAELAGLQQRREQWRPKAAARDAMARRWQVLAQTAGPAGDDVAARRDDVAALAASAAKLLASDASVQQLSGENLWGRLLKAADAACSAAERALQEAWARWIAALGTVEHPQSLESRVPHSDENMRLLGQYRQTWSRLQPFVAGPSPMEAAVLDEVRTLVEQLTRLRGAMVIDAPPEVLHFLSAVEAGRATLADASDAVMAWLRERDRPGRFRVTLEP